MEADDDDNLSTASTISELGNSDEEWNVESILAERKIDGKTKLLVEWEGFRLHEATWEPLEHLPSNLQSDWEETKKKIARGEENKFHIRTWRKATENFLRQKHERHNKRNAVRRSRGMDETLWDPSFSDQIAYVRDNCPRDSSEDEVSDDSEEEIDFGRLDNPKPRQETTTSTTHKSSISSADSGKKPCEAIGRSRDKTSKSSVPTETNKASSRPVPSPGSAARQSKDNSTNTGSDSSKDPAGPKSSAKSSTAGASQTSKKTSINATRAAIRSSAQSVGNVFSGGIKRKKRKSITDVASDGKTEKLLSYRYQRILEKNSRDQENNAPAQLPKGLISLDSRAPKSVSTGNSEASSLHISPDLELSTMQDPKAAAAQPSTKGILSRKGSLKTSSSASVIPEGDDIGSKPQPGKRRKSVHFDDNVVVTPFEQKDCLVPEPSLFVDDSSSPLSPEAVRPENTPSPAPAPPPKGPQISSTKRGSEKLGFQVLRSTPTQKVTKRSLLGTDASRPMMLVFHDIPQNPVSSWVDHFKTEPCLTFSHTCMAQDFATQFGEDSPHYKGLAAGSITAPADPDTLEIVVKRLKLGSQGVFCYTPQYRILLFPAKSEEWDFKAREVSNSEGSLRYIVFEAELAEAELAKSSDPKALNRESGDGSLPENLDQFSNLQRGQVFPSNFVHTDNHHVFLAFPPGASHESTLMAQWLNFVSKVDCVVYDSLSRGDWQRFIRAEKGIMIVHEDIISKLRLFPYMFDMIARVPLGKLAISVLQRACDDSKYEIGDIGPRMMWARHKVFFMTPSFISSQPRQACLFIGQFIKRYINSTDAIHRGQLVLPANFEDWLISLSSERSENPAEKDKTAHDKDMKAFLKMLQHVNLLTDETFDEESLSPVVVAPPGIDANDEQSLVNWFGWWTTTHLEMHGRFYVIGSTFPVPLEKTGKMKRVLQPVQYVDGTSDIPDITFERSGTDTISAGAFSGRPASASLLVPTENPRAMKSHLRTTYGRLKGGNNHVLLFFLPVGHWETDMAYRLGDKYGDYVTFSRWFQHLIPFSQILDRNTPAQIKGNPRTTLAGFFYTPDEDWRDQLQAGLARVPRRPWLAFFRPVNPHERPWTSCELFIWDPKLEGRLKEHQPVYESDLDEVHRRLIRVVIEENGARNSRFPLANVWIGGWTSMASEYDNLLDVTLDTLEKICVRPEIYMPPKYSNIEGRGWKRIGEDSKRGDPMDVDVPSSAPGQHRTDFSGFQDDSESEERLKQVFHPPRGYATGTRGVSLCKNGLFAASAKARANDQDTMIYKWWPTTHWYSRQVEEGRDFKHIMVDSWQNVFRHLDIPADDQAA